MNTIGYMIQDSHGRWLILPLSRHDGPYWDATARMGTAITAKELKSAWETADKMSNGIISGLDIFEWRKGKIENIRQLRCATFIWWATADGLQETFRRIGKAFSIGKPRSITGTTKSFWTLELWPSPSIRVYKGSEQDILVKYTPKEQWYQDRIAESARLRGSVAP